MFMYLHIYNKLYMVKFKYHKNQKTKPVQKYLDTNNLNKY